MTELNIYPDKIENWLKAVIPAVEAGVWKPYHAALMDPPYYLGEIVDRFGGENAAPAKPGLDGSFSRLSRGFMGQTWDGFRDVWDYQRWVCEVGLLLRRVLLPGAIIMSFGGARTWDLLSTGLRMAGFEIYPQIALWTYSTGSPVQYSIETAARKQVEKAEQELSKAKKVGNRAEMEKWGAIGAEGKRLLALYEGYRSDLKPAFEPILVARNPSGMTYLERAAIGTSAMNIDACRLASGRYPKNVIFLHHPECVPARGVCHRDCHVRKLDEQAPDLSSGGSHGMTDKRTVRVYGRLGASSWESYKDTGPASRFYYCPKADEWEKEAGLDDFPLEQHRTTIDKANREMHGNDSGHPRRNPHPTIKSTELTTWLAELLLPPQGIVDERRLIVPCAGVGSEMIGAHLAGWDVVDGVEMSKEYAAIAEARLRWWSQFSSIEQAKSAYDGARKDAKREADGQLRMF